METTFVYTTDVATLLAQLEDASVSVKEAKRRRTIAEILYTVAYLRDPGHLGFATAKEFGAAMPIVWDETKVSRAITLVKEGLTILLGKTKEGRNTVWAVSDSEVLAHVETFVDEHGGKAISGILSAIRGDDGGKADGFNLGQALATVVASARKRGITDAEVVETFMGLLGE